MVKIKPLIYIFFLCYLISYCSFKQLNRVFSINKQIKESSYDFKHNKIYTTNYNKNKYVGLQKNSIYRPL